LFFRDDMDKETEMRRLLVEHLLTGRRFSQILRSLPIALIIVRFLLGPLLFFAALRGHMTFWFVVGFIAAFLSDVFDGVIARRLGSVAEHLREADSWTDTWFYAWIAASMWLTHANVVLAFRTPLLVVVGTQLLCWAVDWAKYRRFATYHQYSAKAWGVSLFAAIIALGGFNYGGVFLWAAIVTGIVSHIEGIAMTLALPRWTYDVPGFRRAWRLRQLEMDRATVASVGSGGSADGTGIAIGSE
jgi:CDP-diacylglycerol--glycerol-3-phosphate 3-phosphatidyltransferase